MGDQNRMAAAVQQWRQNAPAAPMQMPQGQAPAAPFGAVTMGQAPRTGGLEPLPGAATNWWANRAPWAQWGRHG